MKQFLKIILAIITGVFVAFWIGDSGHINFDLAFDLAHSNATPDNSYKNGTMDSLSTRFDRHIMTCFA